MSYVSRCCCGEECPCCVLGKLRRNYTVTFDGIIEIDPTHFVFMGGEPVPVYSYLRCTGAIDLNRSVVVSHDGNVTDPAANCGYVGFFDEPWTCSGEVTTPCVDGNPGNDFEGEIEVEIDQVNLAFTCLDQTPSIYGAITAEMAGRWRQNDGGGWSAWTELDFFRFQKRYGTDGMGGIGTGPEGPFLNCDDTLDETLNITTPLANYDCPNSSFSCGGGTAWPYYYPAYTCNDTGGGHGATARIEG